MMDAAGHPPISIMRSYEPTPRFGLAPFFDQNARELGQMEHVVLREWVDLQPVHYDDVVRTR
jgi:hypothetical protein